MARYHINPSTGNPGICKADGSSGRGCPFGGDDAHYGSKEEAHAAYEAAMADEVTPKSNAASKKIERLRAKAEIPSDQSFGNMAPFSSSEAIDACDALISEDEDTAVAEGWLDDSGYPGEKRKEFVTAAYRAKKVQNEHNVARYSAAFELSEKDSRPLKDLVESGAIDENSPRARLSDKELNTIESLGELPAATQELVQNQPPGFIRVLAETPPGNANVRALAQLSDELRKMNPSYAPRPLSEPPSRINQQVDRRAASGMPQMQKVGRYGYGLLHDYAEARFGDRAKEFWLTVESNSVNYPKISDYMRAIKNFK